MFNHSMDQILVLKVEFAEGGKQEYSEKNPLSQTEIDKAQPMYRAWESIPSRRGGIHS